MSFGFDKIFDFSLLKYKYNVYRYKTNNLIKNTKYNQQTQQIFRRRREQFTIREQGPGQFTYPGAVIIRS